MPTQSQPTGIDSIVSEVVALVRQRVPADQAVAVERFVARYYAGTAIEDLADQAIVDLYGAALSHWSFARQRRPGVPKVRVYNPHPQEHGWQSTHTIVEVVTDDMPFLVDSVRMSLNRVGLTTHLVIHPVLNMCRDADGGLHSLVDAEEAGVTITEAVMHLEVDRQTEPSVLDTIATDIESVIEGIRACVEDWREMKDRLKHVLAEVTSRPPPLEVTELVQAQAFLEWIGDDHFTFLGYREYELVEAGGADVLRSIAGSGLGLLRNAESSESTTFANLPESVRRLAREPRLLILTKANARSTVHRPSHMDYIGIKRFDDQGQVIGERRFLGLYTSAAYNRVPRAIPLLREKVARAMERATYPANSHAAKALLHILETFPRDLLFQFEDEDLFTTAMGILHLQERQRIRLFVHRDRYARFVNCIVYVPRERFNTYVRLRIQELLSESFGAQDSEFTVQLSESVLARLYFVFRVNPERGTDVDVAELESRLREVTRDWKDDVYDALIEHCGEERGADLYRQYGEAFRADYRYQYSARIAVHDVESMEGLGGDDLALAMSLYRPLEAAENVLQFKLFRRGQPISLSDALPMLENMGLTVETEHPCKIKPANGPRIWMHDFGMRHREPQELELDRVKHNFQEAFDRVWHGDAENDGFNRLVLRAGLDWREIAVLRAYCKYLRQAQTTFSQIYIEEALAGNPLIARALARLFSVRFDPAVTQDRDALSGSLVNEIQTRLDAVANLDEDRILRSFLGLVLATLRTNFFQRDSSGGVKSYISFKFDPAKVAELPEPRPMYEIFVYSPRVEGVHLRGGPVARGGLRWSDRREDFRTEVLGLAKAQMVKNAVIVPVGSKGGFVPKQMPAGGDREAVQAEGIACYETFICGLLDVTDNLVAGQVEPPKDVVRHDGDDPYLVVAADKGTATFSDIANRIAIRYGFWLGDAFASGGSQGYDHKGMGITARGAWESVKRNFRELGIDVQSIDFTAIGIGDMGGDVFGNGMLLSEHTCLIGAFNHLHIFIDPQPDSAKSYQERARLFNLPRSSWEDYDEKLISKGGGIYSRSAKSIELSPQARRALGIESTPLTPNELMRAMLAAPVDLLWNGGIGTYVKASHEIHADVGDRANDSIRVDGIELRCKVIGEGGNLGCTQLGRVEFASRGGRVFTDAIDNAGGVDCSDHEVNIKILLNEVVADGDMTEKQRNTLLAEMTDEVGDLVLRNNYLQTQALSLAVAQAPSLLEVHARLIRTLDRDGDLDPVIEFLPGAEELDERESAGRGLTSPELSVLLAYVKISLFKGLLGSDLTDDPFVGRELVRYFPRALQERFATQINGHRLAREIISTVIANEIGNRAGMTFAYRLGEETGADPADIVRAYLIAREVFDMERVWAEIEALDNLASTSAQIAMLLQGRKLVERATRWLLRNRPRPLDVAASIEHFAPGVASLSNAIEDLVAPASRAALLARAAEFVAQRVPKALASRVASFDELFSTLDIVEVASSTSIAVDKVGSVYFVLGEKLELHWLRDQILSLPRENRWQALARASLRDDLYSQESAITREVLRVSSSVTEPAARIKAWVDGNELAVNRCRQVLADLKSSGSTDFAMLSVAMGEIRALQRREDPPPDRDPKPATRKRRRSGKAAKGPSGLAACRT